MNDQAKKGPSVITASMCTNEMYWSSGRVCLDGSSQFQTLAHANHNQIISTPKPGSRLPWLQMRLNSFGMSQLHEKK